MDNHGRDLPQSKSDAVTRGSIIDGSRGRDVQWQWYYGCIRRMLCDAGCAAADVDDLAHDFLMNKLNAVFASYDGGKGRFRGYLQRSVRNAYIDHLRARNAHPSRQLDEEHQQPPEKVSDDREHLDLLNGFFDVVFSRFFREQTTSELGFFLLRDWCISGRGLEESIAEHHLDIGVEHARKLRAQAVQQFAAFVLERLDADDFELMALEAERSGRTFAVKLTLDSIAGVFRWPSESKRICQVALLLKHLFYKYGKQGIDFDSL
jgi:hypothetical protein